MKSLLLLGIFFTSFFTVAQPNTANKRDLYPTSIKQKTVVYQVFTRLFGNTNTTNKPWGTIEENGVGKFNDITDKALQEIKDLGVSHIWYTGVPHHAVIRDYTQYGISNDDPEVVKGRAGSPYAVKDYFNVNPDLAVNPTNRLQEFEDLIARTHKAGLKLIIDIVPNHVARKYEGKNNPNGVRDFGADDNVSLEYHRDNNFYYIPNTHFEIPEGITPLSGEIYPLIDGTFAEFPTKWTGNGSRMAKPDKNDWYETVKVNYGIRPDGTKDFPTLLAGFETKSCQEYFVFWKDKEVPSSWKKFRAIAEFWLAKGVDGFRYDMAEMVPYEFWSYMNSAIKVQRPDAFLLAEVYNPKEYRNYIHFGKMDYLYDKVELYDKLKEIVQGKSSTDPISDIQNGLADIEHHMLHFLDNHDEQRLASPEFAGSAENGKPLMVVSATISTSPTMIYFGQEVGEAGNENGGFGSHSRTSIFDYVGVPNHQRWMNNGKFDGGKLTPSEKLLRDFYKRVLNFTLKSSALVGDFKEIHSANKNTTKGYLPEVYSFVRWSNNQKLIVVANFSSSKSSQFELIIPKEIIQQWHLKDGKYTIVDQLYQKNQTALKVFNDVGKVIVDMKPSESFVFQLQ